MASQGFSRSNVRHMLLFRALSSFNVDRSATEPANGLIAMGNLDGRSRPALPRLCARYRTALTRQAPARST